jgi:YidC/Oxa1 family membrane protein insertase
MIPHAAVLLAENSLFKSIGQIFQPLFKLFAGILAAIYSVIPNYAIAIILLTIIVMGALTPLTVKSTKSMMAMQRLQPEIKRLQAKYKGAGADGRQQMNEELMKLYKEEGINPAGGCIPMLIQMPFLLVLYDVLKGLTYTIPRGSVYPSGSPHAGKKCLELVCAVPRYIPDTSKMYHNLVANPGQMMAFGINLALKPFSHHGSVAAAIPYFALVAIAVALQFVQMRQMSKRNPAAAQANPQMQTMQKVMPILFAYIYFLIPAGVVLYMITSTIIRIATQDILFRHGFVQPPGERAIPGAKPGSGAGPAGAKGAATKKAPPNNAGSGSNKKAAGNGAAQSDAEPAEVEEAEAPPPIKAGSSGNGTNGQSKGNGGASTATADAGSNGSAAKAHPRSKAKRARKAR